MRYVTRKDEELIQTLNLMSNLSARKESINQQLADHYVQNPENGEAAFSYAFFKFLILKKTCQLTDQFSMDIDEILDAFDEAIKRVPDYWIAQMFKLVLLLPLPEILERKSDLVETLQTMFKQQDEAERKESYFIFPYVIYADYMFFQENDDNILKIIEEAEEKIPFEPITLPTLGEFIYVTIKDFLKRLVRSNERKLAEKVMEMGVKFFPDKEADLQKQWL